MAVGNRFVGTPRVGVGTSEHGRDWATDDIRRRQRVYQAALRGASLELGCSRGTCPAKPRLQSLEGAPEMMILTAFALVLAACVPPASPTVDGAASEDRIIALSQLEEPIVVSVGDVFFVPQPARSDRWYVEYAGDVLEVLRPSENADREPGRPGWRFRGVARGETEVVLEPRSAAAASPAPPRFIFTVVVR